MTVRQRLGRLTQHNKPHTLEKPRKLTYDYIHVEGPLYNVATYNCHPLAVVEGLSGVLWYGEPRTPISGKEGKSFEATFKLKQLYGVLLCRVRTDRC